MTWKYRTSKYFDFCPLRRWRSWIFLSSIVHRPSSLCLFIFAGLAALGATGGCGGGTAVGGAVGSAETLTFEGWSNYRLGHYATAESRFLDALRVDSQFSDAYNGLGWLKFQQAGQEANRERREALLTASRTNFQKATAADPENVDAWVGLAGLELHLKNWAGARDAANRALSLSPRFFSSHDNIDYRDVHLILAEAYFFLGAFIHTAETSDPNNALHHINAVSAGYKVFYHDNKLTPPELVIKIGELQGL